MTFSACDLQTRMRQRLEQAGYKFHEVPGEHAWYWQLGDSDAMGAHMDSEGEAEDDAHAHYFEQTDSLLTAAAVVVGSWTSNRLASAVNDLQSALDSSVAGDVEAFISEAMQ